jgi:hypothetical protein
MRSLKRRLSFRCLSSEIWWNFARPIQNPTEDRIGNVFNRLSGWRSVRFPEFVLCFALRSAQSEVPNANPNTLPPPLSLPLISFQNQMVALKIQHCSNTGIANLEVQRLRRIVTRSSTSHIISLLNDFTLTLNKQRYECFFEDFDVWDTSVHSFYSWFCVFCSFYPFPFIEFSVIFSFLLTSFFRVFYDQEWQQSEVCA